MKKTIQEQQELELRAAAQIALLGETPQSLRSLSLGRTEKGIHFKAILASDATEEDREDVSCVATEILATLSASEAWDEDIILSDDELHSMELELLVYRRKE